MGLTKTYIQEVEYLHRVEIGNEGMNGDTKSQAESAGIGHDQIKILDLSDGATPHFTVFGGAPYNSWYSWYFHHFILSICHLLPTWSRGFLPRRCPNCSMAFDRRDQPRLYPPERV